MGVLVTGASGFIGLAVCEALLARGEAVTGFDLTPPPASARRALCALPGAFSAITGDVRDTEAVRRAIASGKADRLIHLAAVTADARRERTAPASVFEVNVGGTLAVIEAARGAGLRRIVHLSSGAVYGRSGTAFPRLTETATPLLPEGLYGISKQAAEAAAVRLAHLHGLDLIVGRLGTCFGPWEYATSARDTPSAPLQAVLRARAGGGIVLPRPHVRDFLYSRDAAAGILALLDAPCPLGGVFNVAAGFIWSMAEFCAGLAARLPDVRWRIDEDAADALAFYAPYDRAPLCPERLMTETGFRPRFGLEAALDDYLPWLAAHGDLFPKDLP